MVPSNQVYSSQNAEILRILKIEYLGNESLFQKSLNMIFTLNKKNQHDAKFHGIRYKSFPKLVNSALDFWESLKFNISRFSKSRHFAKSILDSREPCITLVLFNIWLRHARSRWPVLRFSYLFMIFYLNEVKQKCRFSEISLYI
jgi:hypothetical protein